LIKFYTEWSRIEEFAGNVDEARSVLNRAKKEAKHEWKVFLETVLLELRNNNIPAAIREAEDALKVFFNINVT
jgi:lipopolysaccharide biosynthesis regulator YciM